jgi:hypothetical protein
MIKFIKNFFIFWYHFLFIDQERGRVSHTKFWSNMGYAVWIYLFPHAVFSGSQANYDLWLVFGAVVIGNRSLNKWLETRGGATNSTAPSEYTWHARQTNHTTGSDERSAKIDDLVDDNIPRR